MRPSFKNLYFLTAAFAAVVVGAGLLMHGSATDLNQKSAILKDQPIPVVASQAVERQISVYRTGAGSVEAFNRISLTSRVEGQIVKISFKEGQEVHAGDVLALIDPRPFEATLRSKQAILQANKAKALAAKATLDRVSELVQRDVSTRQALDNQQAAYSELTAQIDGAQADADYAALQLDYTSIRSPINGRIGLRQVDQGNVVRPGDPVIAVVTQVQPISIVFSLPQEDLGIVSKKLNSGQSLTVRATARDSEFDLGSGTLATMDNQIDTKTGTFKLKAIFANDDKSLWPGEFVSVKLLIENSRTAIVVPASTIQHGPNGAYVYVIDKLYRAVMRPVSVDPAQAGFVAVKTGLRIGETVVMEGQFKLRPGSAVQVNEEASSPAVSISLEQPRG